MKIALIGYGKMGHEIKQMALEREHEITAVIDIDNQVDFDSQAFLSADVAIEFTRPETAYANYLKCFEKNMPVVAGTTGWLQHLNEVKAYCMNRGQTFFYASNYSIGVNIFFALNKYLARIMNKYPGYYVSMEERHHVHKLDSPSGTAISLAEDIVANVDRIDTLPINSIREGEVPGTHEVVYESEADIITIRHDAKSRKGFALGAVMAAEFIKEKKGFFTMDDMLDFN
jgi:dihydrodipicolinate reductase